MAKRLNDYYFVLEDNGEISICIGEGAEMRKVNSAIVPPAEKPKSNYDLYVDNCIASGVTPLSLSDWLDTLGVSDETVQAMYAHIADMLNPHAVTKTQVELDKCDNTSDADKPVSIATQAALDTKASVASVAAKADSDGVQAALELKVDNATMQTALALKVDTTAFDTAIAGKANTVDMQTALNVKADSVAMQNALETKADAADVVEVTTALQAAVLENTSAIDNNIIAINLLQQDTAFLVKTGDGTKYLTDAGTYAPASGGSTTSDAVGDIKFTKRVLDATWHICNGAFVPAATHGTLAAAMPGSIYGINKVIDSNIMSNLSGVAYGDGIFVISDVYGKIYWSADPTTGWSVAGSGYVFTSATQRYLGIAYTGAYWVRYLYGSNQYQYANTTNMKINSWSTAQPTNINQICLCNVNGYTVAGGLGSSFQYCAANGAYPINTVTVSSGWGGANYVHKFKYVNGYYFAFCSNNSFLATTATYEIYYATTLTATTWTYFGYACRDISFIGNYWLFAGMSGYAFGYSTTLEAAKTYRGTANDFGRYVFKAGTKLVVATAGYVRIFNDITASTNTAITWTAAGSAVGAYTDTCVVAGDTVVACCNSALQSSNIYNDDEPTIYGGATLVIPTLDLVSLPLVTDGYIKIKEDV